jgi:hypothetical protein
MRRTVEAIAAYEIDNANERTTSDNGYGDTHGYDWSKARCTFP